MWIADNTAKRINDTLSAGCTRPSTDRDIYIEMREKHLSTYNTQRIEALERNI